MVRECKACGSPLYGDPLAKSWTCTYCKTVNYNEEYLREHVRRIDFSKAHNLLQVGIASYESGEYENGLDQLQQALREDSSNQDAWVYCALCAAHLANLNNFGSMAKKVETFLAKAKAIDNTSDVFKVGNSVAANVLGRTALRAVDKQFGDARKAYFSYESTDAARARRVANEEIDTALSYAAYALGLEPDDPNVSGRLAVLTIQCCSYYKGSCPNPSVQRNAEQVLASVKEKNAALYASYQAELASPKKASGCASQSALLLAFIGGGFFLATSLLVGAVSVLAKLMS